MSFVSFLDLSIIGHKKKNKDDDEHVEEAVRHFEKHMRDIGRNPMAGALGVRGFALIVSAMALLAVPLSVLITLWVNEGNSAANEANQTCSKDYEARGLEERCVD